MNYRKLSGEVIKRALEELLQVLETSGAVEVKDRTKALEAATKVIDDYEEKVKALEEKARTLIDAQIKNFPEADYTRALELALQRLSEKERLPL